MLKCVEGIYRAGKVELLEPLPHGVEGRVIVTFLSVPAGVNLTQLLARVFESDGQPANSRETPTSLLVR